MAGSETPLTSFWQHTAGTASYSVFVPTVKESRKHSLFIDDTNLFQFYIFKLIFKDLQLREEKISKELLFKYNRACQAVLWRGGKPCSIPCKKTRASHCRHNETDIL